MSKDSRPEKTYRIAYLIDGLSMGGAERLMVPVLKYLSRAHFEPYICAMQSKDGNPMAEDLRALVSRSNAWIFSICAIWMQSRA